MGPMISSSQLSAPNRKAEEEHLPLIRPWSLGLERGPGIAHCGFGHDSSDDEEIEGKTMVLRARAHFDDSRAGCSCDLFWSSVLSARLPWARGDEARFGPRV